MHAIHGMCFDCVIDKESQIKKNGKWDEYVSEQRNNNKNAILSDLEMAMEAWYNQSENFVTEQGDIESWQGGNKTELYQRVKEEIQKAKEIKF
jgi:hypothetical protein